MTHRDGTVTCNFCGCPDSRATVLVSGQNDSHICDSCTWDCAMMIYEEIKDRYWGEEPYKVIEKPTRSDMIIFADTPEDSNEQEKNNDDC